MRRSTTASVWFWNGCVITMLLENTQKLNKTSEKIKGEGGVTVWKVWGVLWGTKTRLKVSESVSPERSRLKQVQWRSRYKNMKWAFSASGLSESFSSFHLFDGASIVYCNHCWPHVLWHTCKSMCFFMRCEPEVPKRTAWVVFLLEDCKLDKRHLVFSTNNIMQKMKRARF